MRSKLHSEIGRLGAAMSIYESEYCRVTYQTIDDCLIFVVTLQKGQNQFSPPMVKSLGAALDLIKDESIKQARASKVQRAAVVTTGEGKFYSTGLMLGHPEVQKDLPGFLAKQYLPLMGNLLVFPLVTVAAINGHAFAGGMTMALAQDYRVMREDRGFLCMNEIELPSPVPAGMASVARAKIVSPQALRDCFLGAKRFSAQESLGLGMVDEIASEAECLDKAIKCAVKHARLVSLMPIVESIKRDMWPEVIRLFEEPGTMQHVPALILKSRL